METIIESVREFVIDLNPLWMYFIISLVGLFVYWRGCTETRKDRSSIFDTFGAAIFGALVMGRVAYLAINWSEYSKYTWYFLPYEKYADTIYLFRLLPWRLLRVWDGGLTIFVAMVSFIFILTLIIILFKKWRLYQIFFPIFFSMTSMLGVSFIYLGFAGDIKSWMISGGVLFVTPVIFWILSKFLLISVKNGIKRRKTLVYFGILLVTLTTMFIAYEYLLDEVSQYEFTAVILMIGWTAIMEILLIIDINKPNVTIERVSGARSIDIEINQPVKLK